MKRLFIKFALVPCLGVTIALAACRGSETNSKSPTVAGASPTPVVSLSSDVVKISPSAVQIPANGSAEALVTLSISPGFHVNANPATFSYLIATQLTAGKVEGITVGTPGYPAAVKKKFQFAEKPLAVYEGETPIKLNLRTETNAAAGSRSLPVNVRVQACDEEQCFPPATINTTISVTVK
jgi:predicted component of type VI protein secretion system